MSTEWYSIYLGLSSFHKTALQTESNSSLYFTVGPRNKGTYLYLDHFSHRHSNCDYVLGTGTFTGEWRQICQHCFFLPFEKGSTLKGKNLPPLRSKFFPFQVDPFPEGTWCAEKQTRSNKSCLPLWIRGKFYQVYSAPFQTNSRTWYQNVITKTRLYSFDPLKPHFYTVKLGFTGVLDEAVLTSTHNLCFEQKYEKYQNFSFESFHFFFVVKFSIYLKSRVFVMTELRADLILDAHAFLIRAFTF